MLAQSQTNARGHLFKLLHNLSKINVQKHLFSNRIVSILNDLPVNAIQAKTVKNVERQLDLAYF